MNRDKCLHARKWVHRDACETQCVTCETLFGGPILLVGDPAEETPEGLYYADQARYARGY